MAEQRRMPLSWASAALAALALSTVAVAARWPDAAGAAAGLDRIILIHSLLPRIVVAILCGAMLGLSGLLMQRTLRNPLAKPSTLGIAAGAQFALALAAVGAPWLIEAGREGVALAGGLAAAALILAINWRRGLEPVAVVLTGMMVSLVATAGSATIVLADGDYLYGLFVWGGGSLVQGSWGPALSLLPKLALGWALAALLLRPLAVMAVGDAGARSLGLSTGAMRLAALALAVWLASAVTAGVGIIGFVGLAAPALATLSGARTARQRLVAAPLIGALMLWLADGFVLLFTGEGAERVPTGAASALPGGRFSSGCCRACA